MVIYSPGPPTSGGKENLMSAFIGSVWFALLCGVVGYVAGHVLPINKLTSWVGSKLG